MFTINQYNDACKLKDAYFIPNPQMELCNKHQSRKALRVEINRDREHIQLTAIGYTLSQPVNTTPPAEKEKKTHLRYCAPFVRNREDAK